MVYKCCSNILDLNAYLRNTLLAVYLILYQHTLWASYITMLLHKYILPSNVQMMFDWMCFSKEICQIEFTRFPSNFEYSQFGHESNDNACRWFLFSSSWKCCWQCLLHINYHKNFCFVLRIAQISQCVDNTDRCLADNERNCILSCSGRGENSFDDKTELVQA